MLLEFQSTQTKWGTSSISYQNEWEARDRAEQKLINKNALSYFFNYFNDDSFIILGNIEYYIYELAL